MLDPFNTPACLPHTIGKVHGLSLFHEFPYCSIPVTFACSNATTEINQITHLSTRKGRLKQKISVPSLTAKGMTPAPISTSPTRYSNTLMLMFCPEFMGSSLIHIAAVSSVRAETKYVFMVPGNFSDDILQALFS